MNVEILVPISTEITATGMAVLAGVGSGIYPDIESGTEQAVPRIHRYQPTQWRARRYEQLYEQYTALVTQMSDIWAIQATTRDQLSNLGPEQ